MSYSPPSPEHGASSYVEALMRVETEVWRKCEEIAEDLNLSANEIIAIAITDLHSRLVNAKEGRLLISVNAADTQFYTSALEAHLAEADPVYSEVLDHLSSIPFEETDPDVSEPS